MSLRPALYSTADQTTGHGYWSPVGFLEPPIGASINVKINGLNAHHVGNVTIPHTMLGPDLHPDVISTGYPTVLVNKTPIAIPGLSLLKPGGIVTGFAAINVLVAPGNLNTATRIGQFFA